MAQFINLKDEYGIIYEAIKILPSNELKLSFLEALAELEDKNCHQQRKFPKTRLHKIRGIKKAIYRADMNLSEILLSLNLLGFLFHNVLELVNVNYQKIRDKLVRRKTFFNDIRALLKYIWFESWQDLFIFVLTEGEERKLINTS